MSRIFFIIIVISVLVAGIFVGVGFGIYYEQNIFNNKLNIFYPIREYDPNFKFIDPLLAYIIPSSDTGNISSLKKELNNFISGKKNEGALDQASVFFYDLNGRWTGVDEDAKYNPASILKVVIMTAYFRDAQNNAGLLSKKLLYSKEIDDFLKQNPNNGLSSLKIGESYSAESLIEKMIMDSDNGAQMLLFANIGQDSLNNIYNVLGIENPSLDPNNFVISPRAYSLFFRILYNATYLSREMSEKALEILSRTTFKDAIVAGLPQDVTVAHKFGEYILPDKIELHDCGIIYYPKNPYFLCVMTKGGDESKLKDAIKGISEIVYRSYKGF